MAYALTDRAPGASNLTAKNRVWDFFDSPNRTRPANRRQPLQLRRKIRPTATKPASGIPYWPSRDPIQELGGGNIYGFVKNHSIAGVDVLGLRIILDSRDIPVAQIQATKGVPAYTGETNGIAAAYPKREGPDELISKIEGRKCCVKINKASNFTISVSHLRPSDIDRGAFFMDNILYMATAAGKAAVWAHEDRRLLVYQQADEVFLQPVEAESPLVTKCGWICRDSLAQAEEELRHYISKLREDSYWQYKKFVDDNQDGIEKERTIITDVRKLKVKDNQGNIKIMDVNIVGGMDNIHVWNRPTATWTAQCPNP